MSCRDIRESISACVDGESSPEEAAVVREHLASCERCRVLERQMRAVGAGVRQVRGSVPDRFREKVFARLESEGALRSGKRPFPRRGAGWPSRWPPPGWGCSSSPRGRGSGSLSLRVPPRRGSGSPPLALRLPRGTGRHSPPRTGRCSPCSTSWKTWTLSMRMTTRRGWISWPRETPRIRRTLPGTKERRMTLHACRIAGTVALAVFLSSFGVLLPFSGTAFADVPARAAGEQAAESIAPDRPRGEPLSPERLERWRSMSPGSAIGSGNGIAGGRSCPGAAGADQGAETSMARAPRGAAELPERSTGADERRRAGRSCRRAQVLRPDALPPAGGPRCGEAKNLGVAFSPAGEREEAMRTWPFYRDLSEPERGTLRWFLFARPGEPPPVSSPSRSVRRPGAAEPAREAWMRAALREAEKGAAAGEIPVGAVVISPEGGSSRGRTTGA